MLVLKKTNKMKHYPYEHSNGMKIFIEANSKQEADERFKEIIKDESKKVKESFKI